MKPFFVSFLIFFTSFFVAQGSTNKLIKITFNSSCNEQYALKVFNANSKIKHVKSNFNDIIKKEITITLANKQTLSNYQLQRIAKKAKCKVTFVKRLN